MRETDAPVSISIVTLCPSSFTVVCRGLDLASLTGNIVYSEGLAVDSTTLIFFSEPPDRDFGFDRHTLAMWPVLPHE